MTDRYTFPTAGNGVGNLHQIRHVQVATMESIRLYEKDGGGYSIYCDVSGHKNWITRFKNREKAEAYFDYLLGFYAKRIGLYALGVGDANFDR